MLQHGAKVKMPNGEVARVIRQIGDTVEVQFPRKGGGMQTARMRAEGLEVLDARADNTFLKHGPGEQPDDAERAAEGETPPADASSSEETEVELAQPAKPKIVETLPGDLSGETAPSDCVDTEAPAAVEPPADPPATTEAAPVEGTPPVPPS